jgi:hypothetical protein
VDGREGHKVAVRSVDTHPGAPVIVRIGVPSARIADGPVAAVAPVRA